MIPKSEAAEAARARLSEGPEINDTSALVAFYYGKRMDVTPLEGYLPVLDRLKSLQASVVTLEPGDGTRYQLIVSPIVHHNQRWWTVARGDGGCDPTWRHIGSMMIPAERDMSSWLRHFDTTLTLGAKNEWSGHIIAVALNVLRLEYWGALK